MFCGREWLKYRLRPSDWAARPVNLITNQAKEMGFGVRYDRYSQSWDSRLRRHQKNQPSCAVLVEPDATRVACPCSTEAR
jgi:hypothetical protein